CHTSKGGAPFAGGLALASPIGAIYSTNITPDKEHGIGDWSYEDFARLMRTGVTKAGYTVYPAMPYPSYSRLTDEDMQALYAYFTKA
ncbi:c-type cytochrome, partial [Acinetobacter baumannii]